MISFSSGLITRGYGEDHRIITRGMAVRFDFGGISPARRKLVEYSLNVVAPILKTDSEEIGIYSPLEVRKDSEIFINSAIQKEIQNEINVVGNIDHSSLVAVLDEI